MGVQAETEILKKNQKETLQTKMKVKVTVIIWVSWPAVPSETVT